MTPILEYIYSAHLPTSPYMMEEVTERKPPKKDKKGAADADATPLEV